MSGNRTDIDYDDANFNKYRFVEKEVTLTGAAGLGATGTVDLFTVTGTVTARLVAVCTTNLVSAGGGTIEVGTATSTAGFIAQTTGTDLDANEIWHDATPDSPIELSSVGIENIIIGAGIIATVGTGDITAGVLKFFVIWKPVSKDGNVVAA